MCFSMLMSNRRCKRERRRQSECPTRIVFRFSTTLSLSFYSCALSLSLKCTHCFAPWRRMKEQSRERRPHSDIFICVVLTQLNSPSEKLMRRNGLVEEPTGCIHSCHHHLNPGVLNLQLWPPTWMGNDLSVLVWHPLCLQQNHSSSIYNNASLLNPRQHRSMSSSWM